MMNSFVLFPAISTLSVTISTSCFWSVEIRILASTRTDASLGFFTWKVIDGLPLKIQSSVTRTVCSMRDRSGSTTTSGVSTGGKSGSGVTLRLQPPHAARTITDRAIMNT